MATARATVAVGLAVALAGCGGGGKTSASATQPATGGGGTGSSSASTGPVRGRLTGDSHAPKVNANWRYTVTATDASGHPLSGTVTTEFTFGGQVVGRETPPTHPLKNGELHDTIQFPAAAVGQAIALQVVVSTPKGSITLDWPVTVRK